MSFYKFSTGNMTGASVHKKFGRIDTSGLMDLLKNNNIVPFTGEVSFEDPEDAEKPFAPHYEKHIRPNVNEFEKDRVEALKKLRKRVFKAIPIFILLVIGVFLTAVFVNLDGDFTQGAFYLLIMGSVGLAIWSYMPAFKYQAAVKEKVFPNIFSFFGEDYKYKPKGGLSINSLKPSDIIPHYETEHTEDYVKGLYKDVSLEFTEAHLTKTVRSKNGSHTVTIFNGMFVLLSMNKNFAGKTIVKRDGGKIGNWFASKFGDMENVKLEDPVFEEKFEVYSTDQIEARYLLTTSFMERLLKLEQLFGGKGIQCSFYDDKLLLMIPSKENMFETSSIFQPATFVEDINTILEQMSLLFQIIDILKLNLKIGM